MTTTRVILLALASSLAFAACQWPRPNTDTWTAESDRGTADSEGKRVAVECPNIAAHGASLTGSQARHDTLHWVRPALSAEIAEIPEYHDCQRLIFTGGPNRFGPLVGIFAREALDLIPEAEFRRPEGTAVAQIYNFSHFPYPHLLIRPGFSCLYLRLNDTTWDAHLQHTGVENQCPRFPRWPNGAGPFEVTRTTPSSNPEDYPPVARWDWDSAGRAYMGIKCLDGWCEIGAGPLSPSQRFAGPPTTSVKGWYDEQSLAVPDANDKLWPVVQGRIVPEAGLDLLTETDFTCQANPCQATDGWVRVATVYLEASGTNHYQTKMNLTPGTNELYLRRKVRNSERVWQARIISAAGDTAYRRTLRVDHGNMRIPGTARWHWRERDERAWVRCAIGCCESGSETIHPDDWS